MVDNVTNEIIYGIAAKIKEIYKDKENYPIYTDKEEQGEERPCFFIKDLTGDENREIGLHNRFYKKTLNIVIIFFTENGETELVNDVIDNLYELEYIELSDKSLIRAMKLHHKVEDGVLHFFIDYTLFIEKNPSIAVKMNDYSLSGEVKKDEND